MALTAIGRQAPAQVVQTELERRLEEIDRARAAAPEFEEVARRGRRSLRRRVIRDTDVSPENELFVLLHYVGDEARERIRRERMSNGERPGLDLRASLFAGNVEQTRAIATELLAEVKGQATQALRDAELESIERLIPHLEDSLLQELVTVLDDSPAARPNSRLWVAVALANRDPSRFWSDAAQRVIRLDKADRVHVAAVAAVTRSGSAHRLFAELVNRYAATLDYRPITNLCVASCVDDDNARKVEFLLTAIDKSASGVTTDWRLLAAHLCLVTSDDAFAALRKSLHLASKSRYREQFLDWLSSVRFLLWRFADADERKRFESVIKAAGEMWP